MGRKDSVICNTNLESLDSNNLRRCEFPFLINGKRRAKENLHPLLDAGGNMTTEDKEEAEVLNAFFISVFTSQTTYPWCTQPPDLEV